jgi:hypothetical protein
VDEESLPTAFENDGNNGNVLNSTPTNPLFIAQDLAPTVATVGNETNNDSSVPQDQAKNTSFFSEQHSENSLKETSSDGNGVIVSALTSQAHFNNSAEGGDFFRCFKY